MLRKCLVLLLFSIFASPLFAQTPLPYFTDFETTAQRAGWTQYTRGNIATYLWTLGFVFDLSTSPTVLVSPSAEFANPTDTVIQWYVSPPFNFHTGGKVDSFSILVFQPGGIPSPSDSIVLYLLQGSPDPTLAVSKIRLANLAGMMKGFGASMKDTGNFTIPPTAGTSYIAFKYYSVHDWFQIYIDSIYISGNPLTKTNDPGKMEYQVSVYPNPANASINVVFAGNADNGTAISIVNIDGREIYSYNIPAGTKAADIATNEIPAGIYYLKVTSGSGKQKIQRFEIVR